MPRQNKNRSEKGLGLRSFRRLFRVLYALTTAAQFITAGAHKKVLVVGADVMTSISIGFSEPLSVDLQLIGIGAASRGST